MNPDFVGPLLPTSQDITVNVPKNTSSNVVGDILTNLPNILGALGGFFGTQQQQQQQQQAPAQDMTPIYLLGGLALIILLTRK
jgi:hypothetical protein